LRIVNFPTQLVLPAVIAAIAHDLIGGKGDVWRRNQRDRAERECDQ